MENVRTVKTSRKIKDEKASLWFFRNVLLFISDREFSSWKKKVARYGSSYLHTQNKVWSLSDWGSMPEKDAEGNVYNTCYVFDREGKQIGKYRKVHLFDIDVKGGQTFKESDTLTADINDDIAIIKTFVGLLNSSLFACIT